MCSGSRDLFKFWELTVNVLETVQDRDVVKMEDSFEIISGLSNGTNTNDLG